MHVAARELAAVAAAIVATVTVATVTATHAAGRVAGSGAKIAVEVSLGGFGTPPAVYTDPCADQDPYTEFKSIRDDRRYKTATAELLDTVLAIRGTTQWAVFENDQVTFVDEQTWSTPVTTHVWWITACFDPLTSQYQPPGGPGSAFWVPVVSQESVVPALYAHLEDYVVAPLLSWPGEDREFGWLYVNTAQDFRIDAPATITLTASVANVTGSVSASVTATPTVVSFEPGEPDGSMVVCSVEAATAGYSVSSPGCHYRYQHSSAISPTNAFGTRTVLRWEITTTSTVFGDHALPTISYDTVEVAEVQAVVTR